MEVVENNAEATMYKFAVYPGNHPEVVKEGLMRRGNMSEIPWDLPEDKLFAEANMIWRPVGYPKKTLALLEEANQNRDQPIVYNHLETLKGITSKTGLLKALKRFYENCPSAVENKCTVFDSTPTSFIIEAEDEDNEEYLGLLQRYKEISQGRGIEICKNLREIKQCISSKPAHTQWVVQKYLERPLLYHGRKFDLRVWALVTDKGEVYYYNQGYMRTSSSDFSMDSSFNYIHLTNNCLQQFGDNYGKFEDGNTLSFSVLQDYITQAFPLQKVSLEEHIVPRMKDLILDTIFATQGDANKERQKNFFELLGYDFMIDEDFRVWLIEVNTNPYLGIPNAFIKGLLPKMIDQMLGLVLDPIYFSKKKDHSNNFELIYSPGKVNVRRSYSKELLYPIKEFEQKTANNRLPKYFLLKERRSHPKAVTKVLLSPKRIQDDSKVFKGTEELPKVLSTGKLRGEASKEALLEVMKEKKRNTAPTIKVNNRPLPELLKDAIIENNPKKTSVIFHKLALKVQKMAKSEWNEPKNELIEALSIFFSQKVLCQIVSENEVDIQSILEVALDNSNSLALELRENILGIILCISRDHLLKRRLVHTRPLHLLLDSLLIEEKTAIGNQNLVLEIVKNLLKSNKASSYIPGETIENERQRIRIIQHGTAIALICAASKEEATENSQFAEHLLTHSIKLDELKWTREMIHSKDEIVDKIKNETVSPVKTNTKESFETTQNYIELAQYLDMWTGKDLILSEYYFTYNIYT